MVPANSRAKEATHTDQKKREKRKGNKMSRSRSHGARGVRFWKRHIAKEQQGQLCCVISQVTSSASHELIAKKHLSSHIGYSGCHNKVPEAGWIRPQKHIFSQLWRLKSEIKVWGGLVSPEVSLLGLYMVLPMSSSCVSGSQSPVLIRILVMLVQGLP